MTAELTARGFWIAAVIIAIDNVIIAAAKVEAPNSVDRKMMMPNSNPAQSNGPMSRSLKSWT
ncbi:hypothetical protein [Rhizobium sp.]|uniref:hypothetical protein n=1 Tax=Rhizobium sp. TaxID=391 RepID=UPI0028A04415